MIRIKVTTIAKSRRVNERMSVGKEGRQRRRDKRHLISRANQRVTKLLRRIQTQITKPSGRGYSGTLTETALASRLASTQE